MSKLYRGFVDRVGVNITHDVIEYEATEIGGRLFVQRHDGLHEVRDCDRAIYRPTRGEATTGVVAELLAVAKACRDKADALIEETMNDG